MPFAPRRLRRLAMLCCVAALQASPLSAPAADLTQNWTAVDRGLFYTTDQGSRIMPFAWFKALDKADGSARFAADGLARYGYLQDRASAAAGLPVGFMVANDLPSRGGAPVLSMNCAACHTREITVRGAPLRIDGGPALADFYGFLQDLGAAVRAILVTGGDFDGFADRILGKPHSTAAALRLKGDVVDWYADYAPFMKAALPDRSWGPARLDAFGMIFNRLTGLDLDVPANIRKADAPVRYPFLWNASRQDKTQWPGTVPNGLFTLAMGRNLGEVYGVFGRFSPTEDLPHWVRYNGRNNSAQFHNLQTLETLVAKLAPPPYPLPIDAPLAARGRVLFKDNCGACHGASPGLLPGTWKTASVAAGTDAHMFENAQGTVVALGVLDGTSTPLWSGRDTLAAGSPSMDVLANAVGNTLLEEFVTPRLHNGVQEAVRADIAGLLKATSRAGVTIPAQAAWAGDLAQARSDPKSFVEDKMTRLFQKPPAVQGAAAYESRVLQGIWAAAPYLHNGSVPNLWELLQDPKLRRTSFMVGSNEFDDRNVGLATDKSPTGYVFTADACQPATGNGNCGHDWGTRLTPDEKWALIEYMKTPNVGLDLDQAN